VLPPRLKHLPLVDLLLLVVLLPVDLLLLRVQRYFHFY
jgi:hypothetical protein